MMKRSDGKHYSKRGRIPAWAVTLAAASVGAAAVVQERTRRAERNNPPSGRFVTVDNVRLHYVERGEGEPLVLVHGNVVMGLDFLLSGLVDIAARDYRVLVFDRPGFGHSERPGRGAGRWSPEAQARLLHGALVQIGVQRPVVLGHSWGAMVAVAMALEYPDYVRSLVLESGYYYPTARPDVLIGAIPSIPLLGDFLRYTFSPLFARANWTLIAKAMFAPARVPDHFWEFPAWMSVRPSQLRAMAEEAAEMVPAAARLSRRYGELEVPAVIMAGSKDPVAHAEPHSRRLHAELAGSEIRMIEGMGHMLHHLVPGKVMAAIDAAAGLTTTP